MVYCGIDFSINSPGVCIFDEKNKVFNHKNCIFYNFQKGISKRERKRRDELSNTDNINFCYQDDINHNDQFERYISIGNMIVDILKEHKVEWVALEGYSMGATGLIFNIAEATSILKVLIRSNDINLSVISPSYIKKCWTNKGNADKSVMISHYDMRYGINMSVLYGKPEFIGSPVSDLVDAHAILYTLLKTKDTVTYPKF